MLEYKIAIVHDFKSSEIPPSKQVNGHSFTIMPHYLVFTAVTEWRGDVTPLIHAAAALSHVCSEPVYQASLAAIDCFEHHCLNVEVYNHPHSWHLANHS